MFLFGGRLFLCAQVKPSQARPRQKLRLCGPRGRSCVLCVLCRVTRFGRPNVDPAFLLCARPRPSSSSAALFRLSVRPLPTTRICSIDTVRSLSNPKRAFCLFPPPLLPTSGSARVQRFDDRMSAAVRAALAAKRAEHRSRSASPTKLSPSLPKGDNTELPHFGRDLDASIASPFGSPKPAARPLRTADADRSSVSPAPEMDLNQKSEENVVRLSVQTGEYHFSTRRVDLQLPLRIGTELDLRTNR